MNLHGQSKHWRFSASHHPEDNWCFGVRITRDGFFANWANYYLSIWRQQRAIS